MKISALVLGLCAGLQLIGQPSRSFADPFKKDRPLPAVQGMRADADADRIKLSWQPVVGSAGYRIHGQSEQNGYPQPFRIDLPAHPTLYEYRDLHAGAVYTFRVSALCRGQEGPASIPTTIAAAPVATNGPSDSAR